jgi:tRNA A-37 threonylcarbamoyl transferase component Bud32
VDEPSFPTPRLLGDRYAIERELGRGGAATVYLARDARLETAVAVKMLRPELVHAVGRDRFLREVRIVSRLTHPHILPILDSGETEGRLWYAMPHVDGESLRARLAREKQLPVDAAVRWAREIAGALAHAHARGIVHRDVKPENILLDGEHAWLADFGIARGIDLATAEQLTSSGIAVGTPAYMSPEQASGQQEVDGRSDVYSLACVLYEALAGVPPFVGPTPQSVMAQRFAHAAWPISSYRTTVPEHVQAAIERGMAVVAADRCGAEGFARALADEDASVRPTKPHAFPSQSSSTRSRASLLGAGVARMRRPTTAIASSIGIALAVVAAGWKFLGASPPGDQSADSGAYVVLPFESDSSAPIGITGEQAAQLLYDAIGRWRGARRVEPIRVHDALHDTRAPPTLPEASAMAMRLRARYLTWGEIWHIGDSTRVRAVVYDVRGGAVAIRQHTISVGRDLGSVGPRFDELADSLVLGDAPASARPGAMGTRSLDAWNAYAAGHQALSDWHLARAESLFQASLRADSMYASSAYWLAQVSSWQGGDRREPYPLSAARRAVLLRDRLPEHDARAAEALLALEAGDYPRACGEYARMLAGDSLDFTAWYGAGECRSRDAVVIADPRSPSGWSFRSSFGAGLRSYERALELVPTFHRAVLGSASGRLSRMLLLDVRARVGIGAGSNPQAFAALPTILGDTLAFVPYTLADHDRGRPGTYPVDVHDAIERNRRAAMRLARMWVAASPLDAGGHRSFGVVLEFSGRLSSADGEENASAEFGRALALERAPDARLLIGCDLVRVTLKSGEFAESSRLADSLARSAAGATLGARPAACVGSLLALTGRVRDAVLLARRSAEGESALSGDERVGSLPMALSADLAALMTIGSFGAPSESVLVLRRRIESRARSTLGSRANPSTVGALMTDALTLAVPAVGPSAIDRLVAPDSYILRLERFASARDVPHTRALLDTLRQVRRFMPASEITADAVLRESWSQMTIADTAGAIARVDATLSALPSLEGTLFEYPPQIAALVRLMAMRAELAARAGDATSARRWTNALTALWRQPDPELAAVVAGIRVRRRRQAEPSPSSRSHSCDTGSSAGPRLRTVRYRCSFSSSARGDAIATTIHPSRLSRVSSPRGSFRMDASGGTPTRRSVGTA